MNRVANAYFIASGTLVAGSNTITVNVISGSSGDLYLCVLYVIAVQYTNFDSGRQTLFSTWSASTDLLTCDDVVSMSRLA